MQFGSARWHLPLNLYTVKSLSKRIHLILLKFPLEKNLKKKKKKNFLTILA